MASSQSPHRRWSGCPMCDGHKFRDHGQAVRQPVAVKRLAGKRKRLRRHESQDGW